MTLTRFAPAERATPDEIQGQARYFLDMPPQPRYLLDIVPDVLMVLNRQRQMVFANEPLFKLLGQPDASILWGQRPGEILNCVHAFETEGGCGTTEFCRMCGAVNVILDSLNAQYSVRECRIIQRDGNALDLRVSAAPLPVNGERFSVFVINDISHEKRRQSLERIFFHDLLNIAQILMGFSTMMQTQPAESRITEYSNIIYYAATHLVEEITMQRDLSMAENGELTARPAPVDSLEILRQAQTFYQGHQAAENRFIVIAEQAQAVAFHSDSTLLGRVIGNMVKNALEACAPGETVTLTCRAEGDQVVFEVHNPAFIPRDVQLQIFQRSFSTKGAGRGLGTYSMKLLSERYLGGRVDFTTTPEAGTTFRAVFLVG